MRQSQISIFLLVVIVVMIGAGILYVEVIRNADQPITTIQSSKDVLTNLKGYVESCIEAEGIPLIHAMALGGGRVSIPANTSVLYRGQTYHVICTPTESKRCAPTLWLRQDAEDDISRQLETRIDSCLNLSYLASIYDVTKGTPHVQTKIGREDIVFELTYPITISGEGKTQQAETYEKRIAIPVGRAYEVAHEILEHETTQGLFEQDLWMQTHEGWMITKHKPFPYIVYNVTFIEPERTITWLFALQEQDSAGDIRFHTLPEMAHPCCMNHYDKLVYANTPYDLCIMKGGTPSSSCTMELVPNIQQQFCNGLPCKPCEHTYEYKTGRSSGESRMHGESWCAYDSVVKSKIGEGGYSYVGSRHYKHYCLDGKEYIEECADYREELCTEQEYPSGMTHAVCRDNRWRDCSQCETQECCENAEYRDCSWSPWTLAEHKCVPQVPPGLRFWMGDGLGVCNLANEYQECEGFSCPYRYVQGTAASCYRHGDCGNYRNMDDKLTMEGYFESDFKDQVKEITYQQEGLNKNPTEIGRDGLHAPLYGLDTQQLAQGEMPDTFSAFYQYLILLGTNLDRLSGISVTDFLPWNKRPAITMNTMSYCGLWQPPTGGDRCHICGEGRICTEYRCKSLGTLCTYEERNGYGICTASVPKGEVIIDLDKAAISRGYTAEKAALVLNGKEFKGYRITPALEPYRLFRLGIISNQDVRCKMSYLPEGKFSTLIPMFEERGYQRAHNYSIRVPEALQVPSNIKDSLDVEHLEEVMDWAEHPIVKYDELKAQHQTIMALYDAFTGKNSQQESDTFFYTTFVPLLTGYKTMYPYSFAAMRHILRGLEEHRYYIFFACQDKAGNQNKDYMFVELSIGPRNESREPELLGYDPSTEVSAQLTRLPVTLYFDQPVLCNYDQEETMYQNMKAKFACQTNKYSLTPKYGGSYTCTAPIDMPGHDIGLHVTCIPYYSSRKVITLNINPGTETSISGTSSPWIINATRNGVRLHFERYLSENMIRNISIDGAFLNLSMGMEQYPQCSIAVGGGDEQAMVNCYKSPDLSYGVYTCQELIGISGETEIHIICGEKPIASQQYHYTINFSKTRTLPPHTLPVQEAHAGTPFNVSIIFTGRAPESLVCSYSISLNEGFVVMKREEKETSTIFSAQYTQETPGIFNAAIQCTDAHGNYLFERSQTIIEN